MKKNPCGNMQVWMKNICKYLYMGVMVYDVLWPFIGTMVVGDGLK